MTTTIPPMFAIAAPRSDSVTVFDAVPVTEHPYDSHRNQHPTYLITPHRFCQRDNMPSFTIPECPANHYMPAVTLVTSDSTRERDRRVIFHGDCRASGASVYTVYHPAGIPIYVFEDSGHISWPSHHDNVLRTFPGDRTAYRFWLHRWDPDAVFEEYTSVRNRYAPALPSAQLRGPRHQPPPPTQSAKTLPQFVADALIAAAVAAAATCPITMEPIVIGSASVTPCYHVFDATALASWIATGNVICPTCKQSIT